MSLCSRPWGSLPSSLGLGCSQDHPCGINAVRETLPGFDAGKGKKLELPCPRPCHGTRTASLQPLWFDSSEVTGLGPDLLKCISKWKSLPNVARFSSLAIIWGSHSAEMLQVKILVIDGISVEVFLSDVYFDIWILLLQIYMQIYNLGF